MLLLPSIETRSVFMYRKRFARISILLTLVLTFILAPKASATPVVAPTPFYTFNVIAQKGQAGLTGIGNNVSINDQGIVAFVGQLASGEGLFVGDGSDDPRNINPGWQSLSRVFGDAIR
jgi:hypothetical protein